MTSQDRQSMQLAIMEIMQIVGNVKNLTKDEQEQIIKGLIRWMRGINENR